MHEQGREQQSERRADRKAQGRLSPCIERCTEQELQQRLVLVALDGCDQRGANLEPVGQVQVRRERPAERRVVEEVGAGPEHILEAPRNAAQPLDRLPGEEERGPEDDKQQHAPAARDVPLVERLRRAKPPRPGRRERLRDARRHALARTPWSVMSSPRSMMSNPWRSSSSVTISGGFVKKLFQRTNVYRPSFRKCLPSAAISSLVPL